MIWKPANENSPPKILRWRRKFSLRHIVILSKCVILSKPVILSAAKDLSSVIATLLVLFPESGYAKTLGIYPSDDSKYEIVIESIADKNGDQGIVLNKVLSLHLTIKPKTSSSPELPMEKVTFEASMPQHNHGMVTAPVVQPIGKGVFRIDGVKFHMEGSWLVVVTVQGSRPILFRIPLTLK
jgi:hypothetical protein